MICANNEKLGFGKSVGNSLKILLARLCAAKPRPGAAAPVIGVTSCHSREGVTTIALSLAVTAAETMFDRGRPVLLVDANRTRSRLNGTPVNEGHGLAEVLAGTCSLENVVQGTETPALKLLTRGSPQSTENLGEDNNDFEHFWKQAREAFCLVVLDLPSAEHPGELIRFLPSVDQLVLVVESGRVPTETLQQVARFLEDAQGRELWTVLNKWRDPMPRWLVRPLA